MPRVTRAQAEAAIGRMEDAHRCHEYGCNCSEPGMDEAGYHDAVVDPDCARAFKDVCEAGDLVRAYLAQRPDEDTVRRGHKALDWILGWAWDRAVPFPMPPDAKDMSPNQRRFHDSEAAIRAAMYQPEEEA